MTPLPTLGVADIETLRRDGIVKLDAFFNRATISKIAATTIRLRDTATAHSKPSRKWLLTSPTHAFRSCRKKSVCDDLRYLSDVARQCRLRPFAADYLQEPMRLDHIMSIESPKSDELITPWHADATRSEPEVLPPNYFTLKFFVYLNDIDSSNGAFAYLPKSHRPIIAVRNAIYHGRCPFYKTAFVEQVRRALADPLVLAEVLKTVGQHEIDAFFVATDSLLDLSGDTLAHDLCGPAGTLVVFDDRGMHRGGAPKFSNRSILRYNYLPTQYWDKTYSTMRHFLNLTLARVLPSSIGAHWL